MPFNSLGLMLDLGGGVPADEEEEEGREALRSGGRGLYSAREGEGVSSDVEREEARGE